jgi:uncharacterized protein (TIGR01244 family)
MRATNLVLSLMILLVGGSLTGCTTRVPVVQAPPPPAPPARVPLVSFDRSAPPDTVSDLAGFQDRIYREGRLYISGQPSVDALRALQQAGVTAVVNLRTPSEMENRERVPFDEQALARELGLDYVWIPLGGEDHPYTPQAVDTFAAALLRHPGPVLLHCTVGWRASHMWAAYLVRYDNFPVAEAYARGEAIGIGKTPMARLLDRDLKMVPSE